MMEHYKLVLPEHLNHYGFLFGGHLLHWIDEVCYITATIEFSGCEFVTIAMDNVEFKQSIENGEVLKFQVKQSRVGNTSVQYRVLVYGETRAKKPDTVLFETSMTFVSVDKQGKKRPIIESVTAK
jgi:acyl-CoA hydrolase